MTDKNWMNCNIYAHILHNFNSFFKNYECIFRIFLTLTCRSYPGCSCLYHSLWLVSLSNLMILGGRSKTELGIWRSILESLISTNPGLKWMDPGLAQDANGRAKSPLSFWHVVRKPAQDKEENDNKESNELAGKTFLLSSPSFSKHESVSWMYHPKTINPKSSPVRNLDSLYVLSSLIYFSLKLI